MRDRTDLYGTPIAPEASPEAFRRELAARVLLAVIALKLKDVTSELIAATAVNLTDHLIACLEKPR